jgi:hypothetical protein
MHMRVFAFSSLSALVAVGCGGGGGSDSTPSVPTAMPSIAGTTTTPFPFNPGTPGVTVGTEGFVSFTVENIGSPNLVVSSVSYSGDSAIALKPGISLSTDPPGMLATPPVTVPFDVSLVVGLTCTPAADQTYNGTVEVKSNAANLPDISIVLQCVGVAPTP